MILLIVIIILLLLNGKSNFEKLDVNLNFDNNFEKVSIHKQLDVVDQVYCIVMPQRKDYMKDIFKKLDINYTFFNAITPKDILHQDVYSKLSNTNNPKSKLYGYPTRLPLQLSFTMCYLDAIKKGYDTIIVFEDDIIINVSVDKLKESITAFKKSDFAFFYMGYCWLDCKQTFEKKESLAKQQLINVPDKQIYCCHAICYKVKYLKELIDFMYPMTDNLDNNISNFIKATNISVCIPHKTFFDQNRDNLGTLNDDSNEGMLPNCNKNFI